MCARHPVSLPPLRRYPVGKRKAGELVSAFLFFHNILQRRQPPRSASLPTEAKKGKRQPPLPRACDPTERGEKSPRTNPRKAAGSNGGCLVLLDLAPYGQWRRGQRRGSGRRDTHRRRRGRRVCTTTSSCRRSRARRRRPRPRPRRVSRRSSRSTGPRPRCSPGWTRTRRPRRM